MCLDLVHAPADKEKKKIYIYISIFIFGWLPDREQVRLKMKSCIIMTYWLMTNITAAP